MSVQVSDLISKFFIGCLGALYAVYTHLTSELPGIKQSIDLKKINDQIERLDTWFNDIGVSLEKARIKLEKGELENAIFNELSGTWNEERDDIEKKRQDLSINYEKRRNNLKIQAALLFFIIGGSVAALFTQGVLITNTGLNYQTIIAALAIGFAGPGYISKLTELKTEEDIQTYTKARKDEMLENMKDSFEGTIITLLEENTVLKKGNDMISGESIKLKNTVDIYDNAIKTAKDIIEQQDDVMNKIKDSLQGITDPSLLNELRKISVLEELMK